MKARLKLFEARVTPSFLYCSGAWKMTAARKRLVRSTQRRMLRWVVGVRRWGRVAADQESTEASGSGVDYDIEGTETTTEDEAEMFVEWIQRATGIVR